MIRDIIIDAFEQKSASNELKDLYSAFKEVLLPELTGAEFLKIDFPRLPLASNLELFRALCSLGERLVGLHLMEKFGQAMPGFPMKGDDRVEKVEYTQPAERPEMGRVWINKMQYFEGSRPACGSSTSAATRSARSG